MRLRSVAPARHPERAVPPALALAAAWCWRLIVVGAAAYFVVTFLARIPVVSVPIFLALLLTALLHRPVMFLRRYLPAALAAIMVLLGSAVVFGLIGWLIYMRISAEASTITTEAQRVFDQLQAFLKRVPAIGGSADLLRKLQDWVTSHSSSLLSGALAAGEVITEVVAGAILTGFLTLFFLIDGERQWAWLLRLLPAPARPVANGSGHRAFAVLSGWIGGTAIIALIHSVVVGVTLWLLGAPLALVLAVLVFLGSFIPVVGAFVVGGLAVLVTLLTVGLWPGVILLGVLVVGSLLEGHVYQPLIMGRTLGLHPVMIVVGFTVGGLLGGIFGALAAIPVAAAVSGAVKYATGVEDIHGHPVIDEDRMAPEPPPVVIHRDQPGRRHVSLPRHPAVQQRPRRGAGRPFRDRRD